MDKSKKIDLELKRSIHVDVSSENNDFIVASSSSTSSLCENDKEKGASVPGKVAPSTKIHGLGGSCRTLHKPALSSKASSSSSSTLTKTKPTPKSSSLTDSSGSASSANVGISPVNPTRRKIVSRSINPTSSGSILKTQAKVALKKKGQSGLEADLTLESLEADLFEDIGASIQKSSKASHMASSSKAPSGEIETQPICTLKKVDLTSKNMSVARNGGPTSSLEKAPKVIGRPNLISSAALKRSSLCSNQVKIENDKEKSASVPGKVAPSTKIHGLGGSCRTLHKPALSSKASSSSSSTLTKTKPPPKSSSLTDSSGSASSANVGISPVNPTRRKIVSRSINPTSSGSILKTQAKVALKKKGQSGLSAGLMSSKLSSNNTSPASSISEWPSESSSSTSTVNRRSNTSRASIDTRSPCTSLDNGASLSAIDFDFSICESISMDKSKKIDLSGIDLFEGTRKSGKCNLRKSLEWDTAFFTSAGVLDPDELSSMIEGVDKGRKLFVPGIEEEMCRSTDSLSTLESDLTLKSLEADLFEGTRKSGKCNLRKSLEWDTAFFTSAGVLDPDELSSMIEGVDKGRKLFVPGIEEEMCRSTDSLSTLESDLTLKSLEADLFEGTRKSGKCNLRKSLEWDTAFFTSAGVLDPDELSSMIEGVDKGRKLFVPGIEEEMCRSTDSLSTLESDLTLKSLEADLFEGTRKSGKCNLRKSLEWDTTFFTSAGVLDPDELSSMIEGVDKGRKLFVSGIEEEMCRSTDSLSTLESDLTLKSLEADLFEDIGASIQKSSKASHMASSSKAPSGEIETQPICTLKVDLTSKNMPVARNGGPTSSLEKAPKVIRRPNPISSAALKRSLCSNQVKIENDKEKSASVPGKVAPSTKIHGLGGSCRTLHKPALSSKPPLLVLQH